MREGTEEGRKAYEADVAKTPLYHDGTPRPTWDNLREIGRWSWSRSPELRPDSRPQS